jgi:hypothetical protein
VTCLALLLAFYHLVLEKEKMHTFNRFYLLGSLLFSFLVPAYIIYIDVTPIILEVSQPILEASNTKFTTPQVRVEKSINYMHISIGIYAMISSLLFIRFGRNFFKIIYKIRQNTTVKYQTASLVLVSDKILPHTFWNYIFINKNDYENQKIEQELFTHELTHVTQKHTLDVLILEFVQIIFWINPFFILLKKAVQLNHEFLADERVINQHKNTFKYQYLLINSAAWKNDYYLASNLNYSLTKKRLLMMTTQSSHRKILLKKLTVLPLLAGFVFLFAERVEAQEIIENKEETLIQEVSNEQRDLSDSEIYKEYFHSKGRFMFKDKNGKQISKKYSELNKEEKKRLIPPPSLKSKKKIPTQNLIDDLKDEKKYAVWIDGKVINNDVLNNYKASDFSNHFVSFVYKNARSKRFPQEYQSSLYTNKYFEELNENRVNDFLKYLKEKHNIEEIEEEAIPKAIKIIEEKKNSSKREYIDSQISNSSKQSIPQNSNTGTIIDIREKLKDVNNLKIIYTKDSVKFNENWFITIDNQKYFYTFDKKERIARYYKDGKLVNLDIVKEYKNKYKIFENIKKEGKHYVFKTEKEKALIDREFSDLGGMYFRMTRSNKNKVTRPESPVKPYITLRKNNKVFYKLRNELTEEDKLLIPPPPPVPNATKEEILKAKNAYEAWKVRTGNTFEDIPPKPKKNQETQLNKYLKLSENYIGNENRTKKELEEIKKQYTLLDDSIKSNFMSPDFIIENMKVLEAKHKIMMKAKQKEKVYKLSEPN